MQTKNVMSAGALTTGIGIRRAAVSQAGAMLVFSLLGASSGLAQGLHGYIRSSAVPPPAEYNVGLSWYAAIWRLTPTPFAGFQIGLPSNWIRPDNRDLLSTTNALCPVGTTARDDWPERGPTYLDVFQTVEGGPGYWTDVQHHYGPPKLRLGTVPTCYSGWYVNTPGFGAPNWPKALPDDRLGMAQLSNRLLVPPDGMTFEGEPNGALVGIGYLVLPLTPARPARGDLPPVGDQSWTLFLNTANFKGPVAFLVPEMWAWISKDYPFDIGRGLDARGMIPTGNGGSMEINSVPLLEAGDGNGVTYSRIPPIQFPVDEQRRTILARDFTYYSKSAVYDAVLSWRLEGTAAPTGFNAQGASRSRAQTWPVGYDQGRGTNRHAVRGINERATPKIFDDYAFGLEWAAAPADGVGRLPEYFQEVEEGEGRVRMAIDPNEVPASTGLANRTFAPPPQAGVVCEAEMTGSWATPGPAAGPFKTTLADGSLVTYYWYRFMDQPVFQQYDWSPQERENLQVLVAHMHQVWAITDEYMAPPGAGTLVQLDPRLIVTPPAGLEFGYVPIVTRQETGPAPGTHQDPEILWGTPSPLSYGTPLSRAQLYARVEGVPGHVEFDPPLGAVVGVGEHRLRATFIPDDTERYNVAVKTVAVTVHKAPLTVTANDASRADGAENPPFSARYSGFAPGEDASVLSGALEFTTSADPTSPPGQYWIIPRGWSSDRYELEYVAGTLTVQGAARDLSQARFRHTATLLQNGLVLIAGGTSGVPLSSAELFDPWTQHRTITGSLGQVRWGHTATLLRNGRVLVVGGAGPAGTSAELYDPATGVWTAAGVLNRGRFLHTATLLPNGRVLVAGGLDPHAATPLADAELYDPASGTWQETGALGQARGEHAAVLLASGKVLAVGGNVLSDGVLSSAETYDPGTGTWSRAGDLATARRATTATLLPDGRVLAAGGADPNGPLASAELYDSATGSWTPTGSLAVARWFHTATPLPDGRVLVCAGSEYESLSSVEVYEPETGTWAEGGGLQMARDRHTATLLPTGGVLIAGGNVVGGEVLASLEILPPAATEWALAPTPGQTPREQTATLLQNGQVLVAGEFWDGQSLASAELYDPGAQAWRPTGDLREARGHHSATLLPSGQVLVAGGLTDDAWMGSAELYDPITGNWSSTGSLLEERYDHTATLLANGQVLVAGGNGYTLWRSLAELYDPATGTWRPTGRLAEAREGHTATLLLNGKVLVVGGWGSHGTLRPAELYDPATGNWTTTGSLAVGRGYHRATLLPSGRVLVSGGFRSGGDLLSSAEVYDPSTGSWTTVGSLVEARYHQSSTLLPDGRVQVAGGWGVNGPLSTVEVYDPRSGQWSALGSLRDPRAGHAATLLPNGQVLVVGGWGVGGVAPTAELSAPVPVPAEGLNRRVFPTISGVLLDNFYPSPRGRGLFPAGGFPIEESLAWQRVSNFETPRDIMEDYGVVLHGYLVPPITGDYTLYLCSDDQGELWLSSDESPSHARLVASEPQWNRARNWTGLDRRPLVDGRPVNQTRPVRLEAGRAYYVEAIMKEAGGGDNLAVAWRLPGGPVPADGSEPIPGRWLRPEPLQAFAPPRDVTQPGDPIELVNGVNDDDPDAGPPPTAEGVANAIDGSSAKHLNFLDLNSGFTVTPSIGGSVVKGVRVYPANDHPARDPASFELLGSVTGPGGPFTLIAEGSLTLPEARNPAGSGVPTVFAEARFDNLQVYTSYRVVFPTLKDAAQDNSMQVAEVELLGYPVFLSTSGAVHVELVDGTVRIDFHGTLKSASAAQGPYTPVTEATASPYFVPPAGQHRFYLAE